MNSNQSNNNQRGKGGTIEILKENSGGTHLITPAGPRPQSPGTRRK